MENRIKELRKVRNVTQQELADVLGTTQQAIEQYENNKREPKLKTWFKIADFFQVSLAYLLKIPSFEDVEGIKPHEPVILSGPTMTTNSMTEAEKRTKSLNEPMKDYARIVVETDEPEPKVLAIIGNNVMEHVDNLRIRIKPVFNKKN